MKTKTGSRTARNRKAAPAKGTKKRTGSNVLLGLLMAAGIGYGAYRGGESISGSLQGGPEIVTSVGQSWVAGVDAVGKVRTRGAGGARAKVKGVGGSVFSEGEAPTVVGNVPAGWRVETSPDVKAKFGPQPVPGGEDITFVVPVYALVPEDRRAGAYVMEPGRNSRGDDEGGTLASILERIESESGAVEGALGTLSESIKGLESYVTPPGPANGDRQ